MTLRKKTGGRVAGTPNRTTAETKELIQKVVGKELEKLGTMLTKLGPTERINAISKLLPYILPKQSEIAISQKDELSEEQKTQRIKELKEKLNTIEL